MNPISYNDPQGNPITPQGGSDVDQLAYLLTQVGKAIENLSKRVAACEGALSKLPPPSADMIQYKPPGSDKYLNIKEILDDLYERLNKLEAQ